MIGDNYSHLTAPSRLRLEIIGPIVQRFESNWRAGLLPSITEFVDDTTEPDRSAILRELIAVELRLRREGGETPIPKDYQVVFPGRDELIGEIFESSKSTDFDGEDDSIATRNGVDIGADGSNPADSYATISYMVSGEGGRLKPWMDADKNNQLCDVFRPGGVVDERYRIERELGRGGMGVVFLGRDLRLDRSVAIKASLLLGQASYDDEPRLIALREAFAQEARLGANLTHPAIATVYDYGFHDEKPFTIFEYLPGETLSNLLRRRGRLPLEEVRLIVGPIAQALDFAHARRVVHRDLKPDNVRATEQGLFKVLDLGLAREFGRALDWSGFAGTPAYASPEQAAGLPCDGRADQYALALIAFEVLAGHRLFRSRDPLEVIAMHREAAPEAIGTDLPDVVRLGLDRALSKDPNARFANCCDFAVAIGCQLLSAPAATPEILMEADVQSFKVGRLIHWRSFPWLKESVHLALTHDAIWSAYQTEVRSWPLSDIKKIEPRTDLSDGWKSANSAKDEAIRILHRDTESKVGIVAVLHLYSMMLVVLILTLVIGLSIVNYSTTPIRPILVAVAVLSTMGTWLFAASRGLRRLSPWARRGVLAESLLMILLMAGYLIAVVTLLPADSSSNQIMSIIYVGLLASAVIPLASYVAFLMYSKKVAILFTPSYRDVLLRTPHLDPKKAFQISLGFRRSLSFMLSKPGDPSGRVACRFQTKKECQHWAGRLAALSKRPVEPSETGSDAISGEPTLVVLLRQRPSVRYQLLGTVEAKASKRRTAEAGLQVRAAMLGADSVVDLQEEFLPDFHQSIRRLTGTAVRAVDAEGRFEFRSRWYADRIGWVGKWALVLLLVSLALTLLSSVILNGLEQGRVAMMSMNSPSSPSLPQVFWANFSWWSVLLTALILVAVHAWPIALVSLIRGLRWPQLVRPLILTLAAFALRPVYMLVGLISAALWSGGWSGLLYHSLILLDPMNFSMMVFGLLLGRTAWRADAEFRRLIPYHARKTPRLRAVVGGLALGTSVIYTATLASFIVWSYYTVGSQFRLPTEANRKPVTATALLNSGLALLQSNPAKAEKEFREAMKIWEELASQNPSEIEHQVNLEAARTNLGLAALAQERADEGKNHLTQSAARWEAFSASPLSPLLRPVVDQNLEITRTYLRSIEIEQVMMEGYSFLEAGEPAKAEAPLRRAWEMARALKVASPDFAPLRAELEAMTGNYLAWLIVVAPGRSPEQVREAITLAERTVALAPETDYGWGTLSLARYRNGDWLGASSAMERAIKLRGDGDATRWSILAMIHWRQGNQAEARRFYDQATSQLDQQVPPDQDARRLHDEASALLGISRERP
jgi:serine/threonine protein kinase/tetratricopeptide (TPR) repeat protein